LQSPKSAACITDSSVVRAEVNFVF